MIIYQFSDRRKILKTILSFIKIQKIQQLKDQDLQDLSTLV
jgi:hypothetical protein